MPDDIIKPDPSYDLSGALGATPGATPAAGAATPPPISEEERRKQAMLAMEGPERTAHREQQEKERLARQEKAELAKRLVEVVKQKEKLEVAWIDLDENRKKLKTGLAPLLEQEKQVEEEEKKIEEEEEKTGLLKEKRLVEEKRWVVQQKRKQVEDEKWKIQEKVIKMEEAIETNTNEYRSFLDEEEKIQGRLDQIDRELI